MAFTATGDTVKTLITKDVAECQLKINTMQTTFWNQYAYDKYLPATVGAKITSDSKQDWKIPVLDNNAATPFCTKPTAKANRDFSCEKIQCVHDRSIDTGDFYDFKFSQAKDALQTPYPDSMNIAINDAVLSINMADRLTASKSVVQMKSLTATTIKVYTGALPGLSLAAASAAAIALTLF